MLGNQWPDLQEFEKLVLKSRLQRQTQQRTAQEGLFKLHVLVGGALVLVEQWIDTGVLVEIIHCHLDHIRLHRVRELKVISEVRVLGVKGVQRIFESLLARQLRINQIGRVI